MTGALPDGPDDLRILAEGLRFPEGPIIAASGDIFFVEVEGQGVVRRTAAGGALSRIAVAGGPNGLAAGPDGLIYICNNGGFTWTLVDGVLVPGQQAADYVTGRIERLNPGTGAVETLYAACDGHPLSGPNDLVFDRYGGFYFTDTGKVRARDRDHGGVYYARADGSKIAPVAYPMLTPNGIGLSPDGRTLYVTETESARLWAFEIVEPGVIGRLPTFTGGRLVVGIGGAAGRHVMLDGLAVTASGNICLATLIGGCITIVTPSGAVVGEVKMPDIFPTNIAFGGADLRTVFVTLAATGRLAALPWAEPGLALAYPI
jgi:gluconolactonase